MGRDGDAILRRANVHHTYVLKDFQLNFYLILYVARRRGRSRPRLDDAERVLLANGYLPATSKLLGPRFTVYLAVMMKFRRHQSASLFVP